jgi:methionyl-tRNA formyltransferase
VEHLRIAYLGTRPFAAPSLRLLLVRGCFVVGVVTQPDRAQGRSHQPSAGIIKRLAEGSGVPVFQPQDINTPEAVAILQCWQPDLLVLVAYGQILRPEVLRVPRLGSINLHASLLPRYRGASPVAWALYHGDERTGVSVIQMVPAVDAGGILAQAETPIAPQETAGELEARLAELGAPLVCRVIDEIERGQAYPLPQDLTKVTLARRLRKDDGLVEWSRTGRQVCNLVRAMQPWPGAYTFFRGLRTGRSLRVLVQQAEKGPPVTEQADAGAVLAVPRDAVLVRAGGGTSVLLRRLQPAGKRSQLAAEFVNGYRVAPRDRFGPTSTDASDAEPRDRGTPQVT